jgi:hypothetical protein
MVRKGHKHGRNRPKRTPTRTRSFPSFPVEMFARCSPNWPSILQAACEVGSTQGAKDEAHELGLPTTMSRLALAPADRLEIVPVDGLHFQRRFCILHQPGNPSTPSVHLIEAFRQSTAGRDTS